MLTIEVMRKHDAIRYFGSVAKVAEELDITSQAVSQWGERIPFYSAYRLHKKTGGKLKLDERVYREKEDA